jgi:hypothetical protein
MGAFGARLERRQAVLGRLVEIGAELFAMAASCARAQALRRTAAPAEARSAAALADLFCRQARRRADERFRALFRNDDARTYRLAQEVVRGEHEWLEKGILEMAAAQAELTPR